MSVAAFPDGLSIGTDTLPIYAFDEWVEMIDIGTLTAGEVKEFTVTGITTCVVGMTIISRPNNPQDTAQRNYDKLLNMGSYCTTDGSIVTRVKNLHTSTVDFTSDQWTFTYLRTFNNS